LIGDGIASAAMPLPIQAALLSRTAHGMGRRLVFEIQLRGMFFGLHRDWQKSFLIVPSRVVPHPNPRSTQNV
jgi:hypothetical protein